MSNDYHCPVLVSEILAALNVHKGGRYIDATVGDGGHTAEMLKRGATVLGIDRDPEAIETVGKRLENYSKEGKLMLVKGNFDQIGEIGDIRGIGDGWDGILFDLGLRSGQLENEGRGFSFQRDEPLDMRMDPDLAVTAADLVNGLGRKELFELFVKLGQVDKARTVVEVILAARRDKPIKTTAQLAGLVEKVLPPAKAYHSPSGSTRTRLPPAGAWSASDWRAGMERLSAGRRRRLHPATKVFMALRMAVNDELGNLERALPQAVALLRVGGRLAVISFHEGEDRIVKRFFRDSTTLRELNRKPTRPGPLEVAANPRGRSAKLRVAQKEMTGRTVEDAS